MREKCQEALFLTTTSEATDSEQIRPSTSRVPLSSSSDSDDSLPEPPRKIRKPCKSASGHSERVSSEVQIESEESSPILQHLLSFVQKLDSQLEKMAATSSAAQTSIQKEVLDTKEEVKIVKKFLQNLAAHVQQLIPSCLHCLCLLKKNWLLWKIFLLMIWRLKT